MEQKDKELLLKDLCFRLPYGVKVQCGDYLFAFDKDHMGIGMLYTDFNRNPLESPKIILSGCYYGEDIKPYLFPLWRMTKKQKEEFDALYWEAREKTCNDFEFKCVYSGIKSDWLDKNHFDHRGLIPMGLAIDATGLNIY